MVEVQPGAHFARLEAWLRAELEAESQPREGHWPSASGLRLVAEEGAPGNISLLRFLAPRVSGLKALDLSVGAPLLVRDEAGETLARGLVAELSEGYVTVAIQDSESGFDDEARFNICLAPDEISNKRQRLAIARARDASGRLGALRDVLFGLEPARFHGESKQALQFFDESLNSSQKEAIRHALAAKDVAIIHGPPGTGKTRAVIELIRQARARGERVLACAPSHVAVDNILERLMDAGLEKDVLRLGHPARVNEKLRSRCLDSLVRGSEQAKMARDCRRESRELFRQADKWTRSAPAPGERQRLREEAKSLRREAWSLEDQAAARCLDDAGVTLATLTGLDDRLLRDRRYDRLVIDEACQTTEPACWIGIGRAERVVLAGDHCQLPPTVIDVKASREGFARSLQERLVELAGAELSRLLAVQYRMNEAIMGFSSLEFYDGALSADPSVARHVLTDLEDVDEDPLFSPALRFIDYAGAGFVEELDGESRSYRNPQEALAAMRIAGRLLAAGLGPDEIAIISPYSAQVEHLRGLRQEMAELMNVSLSELEVDTVDGFQGREKEAIVVSLVRSNDEGKIGFLSDRRRFNVALTRARRQAVILGDSATLSFDPFFGRMLAWVESVDGYGTIWDDPDLSP